MSRLTSHRTAIAAVGLVVAMLVIAAFWPTRTRVGVNYEVAEHRLPLWRKGWGFLQRDARTRRLARQVAESPGGEERAIAVLHWTNRHVRPHPAEVDVVDNHVWSIIDRGYGSSDQQADVFTTLLTYAGTPAYWILIGSERPELPLSLALIDGRWRAFDVERGIAFRNAQRELATPEELAVDRALIRSSAAGRVSDVEAYTTWFHGFTPPTPPEVLRARMQMPGPRLIFELRNLVGRGGRTRSIRQTGSE